MQNVPTVTIRPSSESLPLELAVALLEALRPEVSAEVIQLVNHERCGVWLSTADPSRTAVFLSRLEDTARARVLDSLDRGTARELAEIMSFPPDTAGALMDTRVSHFRADASAETALAQLRGLRHLRRGAARGGTQDPGLRCHLRTAHRAAGSAVRP